MTVSVQRTHLELFASIGSSVTRIGAHHVFLAVQQLVDLRDVRSIGRRDH